MGCTMSRIVLLLGNEPVELYPIEEQARQYGWTIERVYSLSSLKHVDPDHVAAVFFAPAALGIAWERALQTIRSTFPHAPAVVCQSFSERLPWPEMAEAGAFHCLHLPFHRDEVRQSFTFLASSRPRRFALELVS